MSKADTNKLVPTSTDMLVGMLGNTDKLVSENRRWDYADHKDDDDNDDDDHLDVDADDFINKSKSGGVFKKADSNKDADNNRSESKT